MKDYILKRPMLLCGILCSFLAVLGCYFKVLLPLFAAVITLFLIILIIKKSSASSVLVVMCVMAVIISLIYSHGRADILSKLNNQESSCEFIVCEITYKGDNYYKADVQITDSEHLKSGTKITVSYMEDNLKMGDRAKGKLELKDLKDNDYKNLYYSNGVFLTASLKDYKVLDDGSDFVLTLIGKFRDYITKALFSNLNYSNAATASAIILGNDGYFTPSFNLDIKASGVSHVMVVSGMHLSTLVLMITFITERLFYNRYLRAVIMCLTVIFMIAVCGFTASMIRAGVTYFLMALALVLKRKGVPENTLGAAVTLILIASPFTILNIGFLLSVLATFGVVGVALPIVSFIRNRKIVKSKLLYLIISAITVNVSATVCTLPVTVSSFKCVSVVSVLSNLLISLAVDVILWSAVFGLALNVLYPALAKVAFLVTKVAASYINWAISFFGGLDFAVISVPGYAAIVFIVLIILIFYALLACKKRIDMVKLKEMRKKLALEGGKCKNGCGF